MKPLYAVLVALLALSPVALFAVQSRPAAPPTSPIAFVSVQKILTESAAARAANQQLDALRKAKQDEVNAKKKALDDTRLALANAGGLFSGSRRAELQKTGQRQEAELKQATEDAQKAFTDLQHRLQTEMRDDLLKVINDLARERPVQYILNADTSLVWARGATDLTGDVLERLNAMKGAATAK
jgi:Skp family chaperone for outer membrane proteins